MPQNSIPQMMNSSFRARPTGAGENSTGAIAAFVVTHRSPGEPLHAMALRLGVSRIIEEPMSFEGGLFELPHGERIIKLNAASPPNRKRFTLAHEIGHLLLGKPGLRSSCSSDHALERKCDAIAAELLMPTDEAVPFIKSLGKPSPEKLRTMASRFEVSLQAAAFRVHRDFGLWKCFIACWERHPKIKTAWFVGRRRWDRTEPDSHSLDLALASDTEVQSKELWQRGLSADPVWLNLLRIGDRGRVLGLIGFVN
jgi:IrrE N-terminal-like domain